MIEDTELLRRFADEGAQEAFAELVRRRVDLVYAAALRQTGGDAHLARDVTQGVFLTLAAQAGRLQGHAVLVGWLYTTTRFVAAKAVRTQARWQRREQEANAMNATTETGDAAWTELRPVLDEAMHELAERDRTALLLRFFEGRSLAEVGTAIGLAENSARMRVERALEKLRARLAQRGITSTAAALGAVLANQPAISAPAGLATTIAGSALAGATVASAGAFATGAWILNLMGTTKLLLGTTAAIAMLGLGAYLGASVRGEAPSHGASGRADPQAAGLAALREQNERLKAELARTSAASAAPSRATTPATAAVNAIPGGAVLESLRVLTDLQRRKLVTPEVKLMTGEARITDDFRELFGLSAAEQETLQSGIEVARARVEVLERENLRVTRGPDGEVNLEIRPFPDTGGAAYDTLLKTFADTLGPERYQAFLALGAEQMEKALGRFGASLRSTRVSREVQADGETLYRIRSRASSPPRDNWNYNSELLTSERFREEAKSFLHLLPPDFVPRK